MFKKIISFILLLFLLDLIVFLKIIQSIGFWDAFFIIIITGLVGIILARLVGFKVYENIRKEILASRMPRDEAIDGIISLFGCGFLFFPGIISDLFGLSLIFPFSRKWYRNYFKKKLNFYFKNKVSSSEQIKSEVIDI